MTVIMPKTAEKSPPKKSHQGNYPTETSPKNKHHNFYQRFFHVSSYYAFWEFCSPQILANIFLNKIAHKKRCEPFELVKHRQTWRKY